MEKLLDEIESYWSTRTEGYSEVNHKELAGTQKNAWLKVLTSQFPDKPKEEIRILDIGTGPGFFPGPGHPPPPPARPSGQKAAPFFL